MKKMIATLALVAGFSGFAKAEVTADIVDIAVSAGQFNTLVAAVDAAGLVPTLKSEGPFTVFAPVDAAFAKLPAGTVESLLGNIPALTNILLYHVVAGANESLACGGRLTTVQGQEIAFTKMNGETFVNGSKIIAGPIKAKNGIIYVIDTVLLP